ncbi:MAG: hypothetical protein ACK5H2_01590 [Beutenbergiaceae bacterium]
MDEKTPEEAEPDSASVWRSIRTWLLVAVALAVVVLVLSALIPRTWAQFVGNLVDGSLIRGTWMGVLAGLVFTLLPLLTVLAAWRSRAGQAWPVFWLICTAVLALPNLMTLWIVLGTGNSAHAGERILDVNGPGFRGGTATGAVIAAMLFVVLAWWLIARTRRPSEQESP